MSKTTAKIYKLTVFSLVMITVGSVDSIRNLPATALFGSSLIFFFAMAAIFFLIPGALVSAELASTWPEQGGIYVWVKTAFGAQMGFLATWFQWVENVFYYPAILAFVAATLGYLISPELATNKFFLFSAILCSFWGATVVNLFGMKSSAWFSNFCAISGLLIPMTLIISLGVAWFLMGRPIQLHFTAESLLPNLSDSNLWVSLTGVILSFCGIEISTVHARDVDNPQTAFPTALIISTVILLFTLVGGSLAIAIILPNDQISLVSGIMQAFHAFFSAYHMTWILPLIALMLVIGGMGTVSNWIIAPTKGLLVAAEDGHLPTHLSKTNRHEAPSHLLIYQAIIVSILSMAFLFMPSINGSYWLLTALAAQLYMIMYVIMFVTGIYLRYKEPNKKRLFRIPGGNFGMWLIAGAGIIGSATTFFIGFVPPANIQIGSIANYELLLISGLLVMSAPPFFLHKTRTRRLLAQQV